MIVRTAIKGGILYGAVSYTRQAGVWGTSEESFRVHQQIQKELNPVCKLVKSYIPFEGPALPNTGEIGFVINHYYNTGVKCGFYHFKMIPCYIGQGVKKASDAIKGALDAPPAKPDVK